MTISERVGHRHVTQQHNDYANISPNAIYDNSTPLWQFRHQHVTQQRNINANISSTAIPGHDPPSYETAMNMRL